jgi:hypothetical protein
MRQLAGASALYSGHFERALAHFGDGLRGSLRSGNEQVECWALLGQADMLVRLGRAGEALPLYARALGRLDEKPFKSEAIWGLGMSAVARLRTGDRRGAYEAASRALGHVRTARLVAYWLQHGMAGIAEVFLTLREDPSGFDAGERAALMTRATEACAALAKFARPSRSGAPMPRSGTASAPGFSAASAARCGAGSGASRARRDSACRTSSPARTSRSAVICPSATRNGSITSATRRAARRPRVRDDLAVARAALERGTRDP